MTSRARPARALQRAVVTTRRLTPMWRAIYRAIALITGLWLVRGERDAAVYLRGGDGRRDFVPGLSDIDLAVVLAAESGAAARRVRARWLSLARALPPLALLVDVPHAHEDEALQPGVAVYRGPHASVDRVRLAERPGLYRGPERWRLLSGPDRRPAEPPRDRQAQRAAAWLELNYWWRWAFRACAAPPQLRTWDVAVKLVAGPAQVWLWLVHGQATEGRVDALERAAALLPVEAPILTWALRVHRELPREPVGGLAPALEGLTRLTTRVAQLIEGEVADAGSTRVRLVDVPGEGPLPLADLRALIEGPAAFMPCAGDPADPHLMARLARVAVGPYPALTRDGLVVRPAAELVRSRLRAVSCAPTDPVSFALVRGGPHADFPEVAGWSARDTALRACAEGGGDEARRFLQSIDAGDPELRLSSRSSTDSRAATVASS